MSTLTLRSAVAHVGFDDQPAADRTLLVGTLFGSSIAALFTVLPHNGPWMPLTAALAVSIVVLPRQPKWLLSLLSFGTALVGALFVPTTSGLPWLFAAALGIPLAFEGRSWSRRALLAIAPMVSVAWTLQLAQWTASRHAVAGPVLHFAVMVASGLFVAAAVALAHLKWAADPVEYELGDGPVRTAWERVCAALERWPRGLAREQVLRAARDVARQWLAAEKEQAEVGALDGGARAQAQQNVDAITARMGETKDEELRAHLGQSLRVHRDTLEHCDALERRRERAAARASALASWLDTARFTVEVTPAAGQAQVDAAARLMALAVR
ncbi:MAG: hypothetical protein U0228_30910 [Myxococcaceae bacterium]